MCLRVSSLTGGLWLVMDSLVATVDEFSTVICDSLVSDNANWL